MSRQKGNEVKNKETGGKFEERIEGETGREQTEEVTDTVNILFPFFFFDLVIYLAIQYINIFQLLSAFQFAFLLARLRLHGLPGRLLSIDVMFVKCKTSVKSFSNFA